MNQITYALFVFFSSTLAFAGPLTVGNGGDVVVCRDPQNNISSVELLDIYETRFYGYGPQPLDPGPIAPSAQFDSTRQTVDFYLREVIAKINPTRAKEYSDDLNLFEKNTNFASGIQLSSIPDTGFLALPPNCALQQIAIQAEPTISSDKIFLISKDLWDHLDSINRAGLVLHEIIYREAIRGGAVNSRDVRRYNGMVLNGLLLKMSWSDLAHLYRSLYFKQYDYHNFPVSTCLEPSRNAIRENQNKVNCLELSQRQYTSVLITSFTLADHYNFLKPDQVPFLKQIVYASEGSQLEVNDQDQLVGFRMTFPQKLWIPSMNLEASVYSYFNQVEVSKTNNHVEFEFAQDERVPTSNGVWVPCKRNPESQKSMDSADLINFFLFADPSDHVTGFGCIMSLDDDIYSPRFRLKLFSYLSNKTQTTVVDFDKSGLPVYSEYQTWYGIALLNNDWIQVRKVSEFFPSGTAISGEGVLKHLPAIVDIPQGSWFPFTAYSSGNLRTVRNLDGALQVPYSEPVGISSHQANCETVQFNEDGSVLSVIPYYDGHYAGKLLDLQKKPVQFKQGDRVYFDKNMYVTKIEKDENCIAP